MGRRRGSVDFRSDCSREKHLNRLLRVVGVIWKADPQQVEHLREGSARKTRTGDHPDLNALFDFFLRWSAAALRTQTGPYQGFFLQLLVALPTS